MNPYRTRSPGTAALEVGARPTLQSPGMAAPAPPSRTANFETANMRTVVSRFGGLVQESNAVHIPNQNVGASVGAADNDLDFQSRFRPACANVYAGIPGYMGFRPHASHHSVLGEKDAPAPRERPLAALDTSKQPYVMPVVGFIGHIRGLADADKNYGTSHWKNAGNVNPSHAQAASKPWDGRDVAGRPHGGYTPGDFGRYPSDPDYARMKAEADEANEILELRSMGIRALLQAKPQLGGSRS